MKKSIVSIVWLFTLTFSCLFIFTTNTSQAKSYSKDAVEQKDESDTKDADQEIKPKIITHSFPGVSTFMTSSGRLGFFEQGTGMIYLYDSNFENCVFKGQLSQLGEPITPIEE